MGNLRSAGLRAGNRCECRLVFYPSWGPMSIAGGSLLYPLNGAFIKKILYIQSFFAIMIKPNDDRRTVFRKVIHRDPLALAKIAN